MAKIPINKFPNQAGYLQFDTNNNRLEINSDGSYKPIAATPFDHNIDIYVGPGGDFTDINEALAYIQYLQPKFRTVTEVTKNPTGHYFDQFHLDLQINLIFKEGYVFTHPIVFENVYAPWLNITQENLDIPLEINIPYNPDIDNTLIAIGMFQSRLRDITLNVKNTNLTNLLMTPLYMVNSTLNELRLEVQDVQTAIYMSHNSIIKEIKHFVANRIRSYAIYLCYNSYTMVRIEPPTNEFNISDVGITHPNYDASAICLTESNIQIYANSTAPTHYINNVNYAFRLRGQSQLTLHHTLEMEIDNVNTGIFYASNDWGYVNAGTVSLSNPLKVGTNIVANTAPLIISPNTFNKNLLILTAGDLTVPITP